MQPLWCSTDPSCCQKQFSYATWPPPAVHSHSKPCASPDKMGDEFWGRKSWLKTAQASLEPVSPLPDGSAPWQCWPRGGHGNGLQHSQTQQPQLAAHKHTGKLLRLRNAPVREPSTKLFIIFLNALFYRMEMLLLSCYHLGTNRTKIQSMTKKLPDKHRIQITQVLLKLSKYMVWRHGQI